MENQTDGWGEIPEEVRNDTFMQIFRELTIVREHPRMLVLVAHGFIEMLVGALIDAKSKNAKKIRDDSRSYPISTKLLLIHELGLIDDVQYKQLDAFRKLRNRAAHDPIFTRSALPLPPDAEPQDFLFTCFELVGSLWNRHLAVFVPRFAPSLVKEDGRETP